MGDSILDTRTCLCFRGLGLGVISAVFGASFAIGGLAGVSGARFLLLAIPACIAVAVPEIEGVEYVLIRYVEIT